LLTLILTAGGPKEPFFKTEVLMYVLIKLLFRIENAPLPPQGCAGVEPWLCL
jgi:hypothetical protein